MEKDHRRLTVRRFDQSGTRGKGMGVGEMVRGGRRVGEDRWMVEWGTGEGRGGGGGGRRGDSECWIDQMKSGSTSKLLFQKQQIRGSGNLFYFWKRHIIICLFPIVILLIENTGCGFSQVVNLCVCV